MQFLQPQSKKYLILFIGCFLIPAAVTVPMILAGMDQVNVSGVLNDPRFSFFAKMTGLFMLVWSALLMNMISHQKKLIILFVLTAFTALFLPYDETHQLISLIHIFSAYGGFVCAALVLYPVLLRHRKIMNLYGAVLLFCIMHSLSALQVTGLSEWLFAVSFSIVLSVLTVMET